MESVAIKKIKTGKHTTTEEIVLTFNDALDQADAQQISSFSLTTVAKTKKQKSKPVALLKATYNSEALTVTLTTRKPLVLSPPLELTVKATSLLDALGRPLNSGANMEATLKKSGGVVMSAV